MVPRFDLVDIVQTLQRKLKFIILVAVAAAVVGAIFHFIGKKEYKAKSTFFVASANYNDRTNIFRSEHSQFIDYFAKEDDVDKIIAIAKSDSLKRSVILKCGLDKVYKKDASKPADMSAMVSKFDSKYDVRRDEYTSMEVSFKDEDPKVAALVANEIVNTMSDMYGGFFAGLRGHIRTSISSKIAELDSSIAVFTDSLGNLRERYQLFDLVSPARKNVISGNLKSSAPGFGRGVEEIQNVESVKDQLVIDRAGYISTLNEFSTSTNQAALPMLHILSKANEPTRDDGLGLIVTIVVCGALGFFFICLWILLITYFRAILNTPRS